MQQFFPFKLKPVSFKHQTAVDYCGTSAVAIGWCFNQVYKKRDILPVSNVQQLELAPSYLSWLIKKYHKHESQSRFKRDEVSMTFVTSRRCTYCSKPFKCSSKTSKSGLRACRMHELMCPSNTNRLAIKKRV